MNSLMQEFDDRRVWALDGHEITRLSLDYRFSIEIWWREEATHDNRVTVTISNRFVLHRLGQQIEVNPEQPQTVGSALSVLYQPVDSLTVYRDGRLVLRMLSGDEIVVEKDWNYESWEANGTGTLADIQMVCSPPERSPWGG
ncbi:MAG: hypothetical protein JSS02_17985 [Planctomycetes bacterium]|nr:hypothetical protein [Planctomycetota bacterium]